MAKTYDLKIDAGATYTVSFRYLENDGITPFDLTDYSVQCQFRDDTGNLVLTPDVQKVALEGLVILKVTAAESSAFSSSPLFYGVELHSVDDVIRLVQGQVWVSPEVVR